MLKLHLIRTLLLIALLFPAALRAQSEIKREFRGVWIATVGNIDWPSSKNLSSEEQKKEIVELLDMCKSMNFNAIIFQIRPAADAFYDSNFEPWSRYLTGMNGEAPTPYYDPLAFIVEETHKRGMEFHAWINPYRAMVNYQEYQPNPYPLTYERPEWFVNYGKHKYFNPGIPAVREYTLKIVTDVVQNYNVDAVHFDDYFYPYQIENQSFADEDSFQKFGGSYYPDRLEEWRRNNVNSIIQELYHRIKELKPWVQFGVSPFGIWRNQDIDARGSATQAGQTNYDHLYADIALWIKKGWLDYILPQAYWHIGHEKADYREVVKWWSENSFGTRLYIGHGLYKMADDRENLAWRAASPTEIEKQLQLNKSMSKIEGSAFFSARSLLKNPENIREKITRSCFSDVTLPPRVNDNVRKVPQPVYDVQLEQTRGKSTKVTWESLPENNEKEAVRYLVNRFSQHEVVDMNDLKGKVTLTGLKYLELTKQEMKHLKTIVIRAVSRNNDVSSPIRFDL